TFDTDSGVTEYYGAAAGTVFSTGFGVAGNEYYDLRIAVGAGTKTLDGAIIVLNNLHIAGGVLDVSTANHRLTVGGNWSNGAGFAGFLARQGTVDFNKPAPGPIEIRGNNRWYVFEALVPDLEIHFENDLPVAGIQITQQILTGGVFRVQGGPGSLILLTRLTDTGLNPGNPPVDPGDDEHFWFFDLIPGATLDMQYVEVYYSNARAHPVSVPPDVDALPYITYFSFKWLAYLFTVYSYTEDSDYDGKIDRIRVTTEAPVGDDFSDFHVEVVGYEVDTSRGSNGFSRPVPGATFYIYLREKPYLDTGAAPDWRIVRNTSLYDSAFGTDRVGNLSRAGGVSTWMTPGDTAWPVIGYTLSVPGHGETFVHFSEPVVRSGGGSLDATDFGAVSFTRVSGTAPRTLEALVGLGPYGPMELAAGATNLTATPSIRDLGSPPHWEPAYGGLIIGPPPPTYPDPATGYLGNPNLYGSFGSPSPDVGTITRPVFTLDRGGNNVHRVSDLMISVPPSDMAGAWSQMNPDSFFAWPLWAKDSAYVPGVPAADYPAVPDDEAAGRYVGFVRRFDGTRFLRDQDFDMQVET
ncbi:MAG TPA: hypothetical protein VLH39_09085, partial [Magnetospirillaceae bacterium]|nr:hypothetical protein [Magnetospirillaceae bacterium]